LFSQPQLDDERSMNANLMAAVGIAAAGAASLAPPAVQAFDIQGHRGARGLAPENTLAAFRRALDIGVTTLEADVAVTKDGVPVISHNRELNPDLVRDTSGHWLRDPGPAIHSLSLSELRQYDIGRINPLSRYARDFPEQTAADGARFPALAELLQLAMGHGKVRVNLETKLTPDSANDAPDPATFARLIVDEIRRFDMLERVTMQSFDWRTLVEAKRIAPGIETSCLTIESANMDTMRPAAGGKSRWHAGFALRSGSVPALVKSAGCGTWSMFWQNLTPALVADAHAIGIKVLPWTVNDAGQMGRLIDMGVDGIITDYPDRLRQVAAAKGLALP
jgi:glycerophosphoryl diester phosphodiesterase